MSTDLNISEDGVEILPSEDRQPFYYQDKMIEWGKDKDKLPLFVEMRLGKTLVTIRWAKEKQAKRILIVCPKTVIHTWLSELKLEGIDPLFVDTKLIKALNGAIGKFPGWFVTNYETLTWSNLSELEWDVVILDESTKIRNIDTKIQSICTNDFENVPYKAILAGKPAPETEFDYFNQFKFLYGEVFGIKSWYEFRSKFSIRKAKGTPSLYLKAMLAEFIAEHCYVLKREQVNIGSKKIYSQRYTYLDADAQKAYNDFETVWLNEDFETQWAIVAFNYLHQMSGGLPKDKSYKSLHKVNEIKDMLANECKGEQVVIWCRFNGEVEELVENLPNCAYINGSITGDKREQMRLDFMKGNYQTIVCQIQCASMGIDLSASDTVFYYSSSFSCLDRMQSEDRVIHPDKTKIISFTDFLTDNTIDIDIHLSLQRKIMNQEEFYKAVYDSIRKRLGK